MTSETQQKFTPRQFQYVWRNIIIYFLFHLASLYAIYLMFTSAKWQSSLYCLFMVELCNLGVTAGVHRLWAHRSYKAVLPLRLFFLFLQTMSFQDSVFVWVRDHRMHHKYNETDADPHNTRRGFFFSHIGWLLVRRHPETLEKGKGLDLSDIKSDPWLMFQHKYYVYLLPLVFLAIPMSIPCYFWGETLTNSFYLNILRYILDLNIVWMVNSVAHFVGPKPYDTTMNPAENIFVSIVGLGEGWHNYHHVFPWDYRTSEFGNYINLTCRFIDAMAKYGWAYDLRAATPEMIKHRVERFGDGSHAKYSKALL